MDYVVDYWHARSKSVLRQEIRDLRGVIGRQHRALMDAYAENERLSKVTKERDE